VASKAFHSAKAYCDQVRKRIALIVLMYDAAPDNCLAETVQITPKLR
jgi:hypothetical protein